MLPEADTTGSVSLVAYVLDRFQGATRVTSVANVSSLAGAFLVSRRLLSLGEQVAVGSASDRHVRRLLAEASDEFGGYMANFSSSVKKRNTESPFFCSISFIYSFLS